MVALRTLTVLLPSRIDLVTWVQRRSRGGPGSPVGSRGLGDPMGPSGWFDESSDDS